ncbi:DsbA family oxidoreductase [Shewanella atlantica]|uniref:DsbA family protein n=1 Tax=Shewanella atlantica TaxID=271099 RepID=A0A431WCF7_9GAMM|nr:DsbA family protein [Shewanella atlantica]RTR33196.1 DsbA family protein [Shewanella atlantica]
MQKKLRVDFFHDVICGWCYVLSPRLRQLASELDLDVHHHAFALSASKEEMVAKFGGSMTQAKKIILGHWEQCALADDQKRVNVEGMRKQSFEYPTSLPGLLACKAAKIQGGEQKYWDYFDAVQHAHMSENRNIADMDVLADIAADLGLDKNTFQQDYKSQEVLEEVNQDRQLAQQLSIQSVPSLVINEQWLISGAQPLDELRQQLKQMQESYN